MVVVLANKTEAQRLLSVLKSAVDGLTCLARLPAAPTPSCTKNVPPDVAALLHQQWHYEAVLVSSSPPSSSSSTTTISPLHLRRLHQTTRHLARALSRSQDDVEETLPMSAALAAFLEVLHEWKDLVAQTCSTTLQDDLRCAMTLGGLMDKEKLALDTLSSLQHTSQVKAKEWAKETAVLHTLLLDVQGEVATWQAKVQEEEATNAQQTEATLARAAARHEATTAQLTQAIATLVSELARQAQAYQEAENQAKDEQGWLEGELNALLHHYETAVQAKEEALACAQAVARAEREELLELQAHFAIVESQQAELRQMEEARQQRMREEETRMRHVAGAAVRIQAVFRGFKAWAAFKKSKATKTATKKTKGKKKGGGTGAGKGGDTKAKKEGGEVAKKKGPMVPKEVKKPAAGGANKEDKPTAGGAAAAGVKAGGVKKKT